MKLSAIGAVLLCGVGCVHVGAQQQITTPRLGLQVPAYGQTNYQVPLQYDLYRLDSYVLQVPPANGVPYYTGNGVSRVATQSDIQTLLGQAGTNSSGWLSTSDWNRFNTGLGNAITAPAGAGVIKWTGTATADAATSDIVALLNGSNTLSLGSLGATSLNLNQGGYAATIAPPAALSASYTWHWPGADGNGVLVVNSDQLALDAVLPLGYVATTVSTDPSGSCAATATLEINSNSPYDVSACLGGTWQVIAKGGGTGGGISTLNATSPVTGSISGSTLNLSLNTVPITLGGTGATTATAALTNLGAQPSGNYLTGLMGDGTASGPGNVNFTLATVNSASGQCGDAGHVCQITTDTKGRVIAQGSLAISGLPGGVNLQTSSYTVQASDVGKLIAMNCSAACTVTLSASPSASFFTSIESIGSVLATVSLNGKLFNRVGTAPVLNSYRPLYLWSDGTNYYGDGPLIAGSNVTLSAASNGLTIAAAVSGSGGNLNNGQIFSGTNTIGNQADVIWNNNATPPNGHNLLALISNGANGLTLQVPSNSYSNQLNFAIGSNNNNAWSVGNHPDSSNLFINTWNGTSTTNILTLTKAGGVSTPNNTLDDGAGNMSIHGGITAAQFMGAGVQGSDAKILSSGTISGTGTTLCTDANGGATTVGCPSGGSGGSVYPFAAAAAGKALTIGTDCSTATPCPVRVGSQTVSYSFASEADVASGAQDDLVFVYIDAANPSSITVGSHYASVSCPTSGNGTGCIAVTGVTNFPPESIPLYRWTIFNGSFSSSPDFDARANLYTSTLAGSGCIIVTHTAAGRTVSLDTTNPSCATGGGGGAFNGGTITAPETISTSGYSSTPTDTTNSPLLKLLISNSGGYNVLALDDDLGNEWQVGVGGSAVGSPLASSLYLYDKKNSNAFFTVSPTDDRITVANQFTVTSADTNATSLWLKNTSSGGHTFNFSSGGSAANPGVFDIWDSQFLGGGEPFAIDDTTSSPIIRTVSAGKFAWSSSGQMAGTTAHDTALARTAAGEVSIQYGSGSWGTLDVNNVKLGTSTAPACDSGHIGVINLDASKHLQICDGTAYHTITYTN